MLASDQQHDKDGFLLKPDTPFHGISSWSVQKPETVYLEPFRFDYKVHNEN